MSIFKLSSFLWKWLFIKCQILTVFSCHVSKPSELACYLVYIASIQLKMKFQRTNFIIQTGIHRIGSFTWGRKISPRIYFVNFHVGRRLNYQADQRKVAWFESKLHTSPCYWRDKPIFACKISLMWPHYNWNGKWFKTLYLYYYKQYFTDELQCILELLSPDKPVHDMLTYWLPRRS